MLTVGWPAKIDETRYEVQSREFENSANYATVTWGDDRYVAAAGYLQRGFAGSIRKITKPVSRFDIIKVNELYLS